MPDRIHSIVASWPGSMGISARPRGGDWLADEIKFWSNAGIRVVVSLLEKAEAEQLELCDEGRYCETSGIVFCSFPVPDRGVPGDRSTLDKLLVNLEQNLRDGKGVLIHCRQGIGRAGLIASALLVRSGMTLAEAVRRVAEGRGAEVPETEEQRLWLRRLAEGEAAAQAAAARNRMGDMLK